MTDDERDGTVAEQAVSEIMIGDLETWDVLRDAFADTEHAFDVAQDVVLAAEMELRRVPPPVGMCAKDVRAIGAAAIGMALGMRAERIRQRRHGTHPTEVLP